MIAKEGPLTQITEQTIYRIPFFQRGYVWKQDNWEELWEELISAKDDCFLGSVILKKQSDPNREVTYKMIIDGQQRLTTLSILLRALNDNDFLKYGNTNEIKYNNTHEDFIDFLYFKKTIRTEQGKSYEYRYKIEHSKTDRDIFKNIIDGKYTNTYQNLDENIKLLACYKFFMTKLQSASNKQINHILKKLTLDSSNILVFIELGEAENEQAIFDTINSAGVKLTNADMIKNFIFQKIIYHSENLGKQHENIVAETDEFYKKTWFKHFEQEDELKIWHETKLSGRVEKTNIDMFLHCFAVIKGWYNPAEHRLKDLVGIYKNNIKHLSVEQIKNFVNELCQYSTKYKETFIGFDDVLAYSYDDEQTRLLQILNTLNISTFDAYILNLIMTRQQSEVSCELKKLERIIIRNFITSSNKTKNYNNDSISMLKGNFNFEQRLKDEDINDLAVENSLRYVQNYKAKLLLFWIELYRHSKKESDLYNVKLNYSYELEHVMPQKWQEYWGLNVLPVKDENNNIVEDNLTASKIRSQKVYEIGNMTLLTSKLNKELRNYNFKDKVNGKELNGKFLDGMSKYASLSVTKEVINNTPLVWNEQKIAERTKKLTAEILEIWPNKID